MVIGNKVSLKYQFVILDYSTKDNTFTINIKVGNNLVTWTIPICIGLLGIYPKGSRYVIPSAHLAKDHPQYYKMIDANKLIVEHRGVAYRIVLDTNFYFDGKYSMVPIDREMLTLHKVAEQHDDTWIEEICEELKGTIVEGVMCTGFVVRMFSYTDDKLLYYETLPTQAARIFKDITVVIHDEYTNVEYPLPFEYLIIK